MKILMFMAVLLASALYGQEVVYQGKVFPLMNLRPVGDFEEGSPKEGSELSASKLLYASRQTNITLLIHPLTAHLFENLQERDFLLLNDDYFWKYVGTLDEGRGFMEVLGTLRWKMERNKELKPDFGEYYRFQPVLDRAMEEWTNGSKTNITHQERQEEIDRQKREASTQFSTQ